MRDARAGFRVTDKFVRVWLKSGLEASVLIHLGIGAQVDRTLPERAYIHGYRIYDRYRQTVARLIVLADKNRIWRPHAFEDEP